MLGVHWDCVYINCQLGELLIVPIGIKMDYDFDDSLSINTLPLQYTLNSSITAFNKDESNLSHCCNFLGENLSLYKK